MHDFNLACQFSGDVLVKFKLSLKGSIAVHMPAFLQNFINSFIVQLNTMSGRKTDTTRKKKRQKVSFGLHACSGELTHHLSLFKGTAS